MISILFLPSPKKPSHSRLFAASTPTVNSNRKECLGGSVYGKRHRVASDRGLETKKPELEGKWVGSPLSFGWKVTSEEITVSEFYFSGQSCCLDGRRSFRCAVWYTNDAMISAA